MSKNTNRARLNQAQTSMEYNKIRYLDTYGVYWDGDHSWKNNFPNHKGRSYKTWKHTRKHQWK